MVSDIATQELLVLLAPKIHLCQGCKFNYRVLKVKSQHNTPTGRDEYKKLCSKIVKESLSIIGSINFNHSGNKYRHRLFYYLILIVKSILLLKMSYLFVCVQYQQAIQLQQQQQQIMMQQPMYQQQVAQYAAMVSSAIMGLDPVPKSVCAADKQTSTRGNYLLTQSS